MGNAQRARMEDEMTEERSCANCFHCKVVGHRIGPCGHIYVRCDQGEFGGGNHETYVFRLLNTILKRNPACFKNCVYFESMGPLEEWETA